MQIDISALSILVSLGGLCVTIYTIIKGNAKNQAETMAKIELIKNDIKHLSDRVEKHNEVVERTYGLEEKQAVFEQQLKVEQHRMNDVEEGVKKINDKMINMTRRN